MAASQTLTTVISINAKANGFSEVGATLTELGTMVDGISQQLIEFGKESWETYKDYEKSMHEAEVALSTSHGRNTKELAEAMDVLNAKATEWAATTIFHTEDVANAINQAAHAGWDLDDILTGIPVAMQLAQAGSMDLSQALTYITKSMAAFGVPFDEMDEFIDMWVYAANSSVGDVQDFGDAMKKMGATMRFTDSKEELFALIGLMHDMGESGSTAATLLRTSMMRILAPSGVTSKVLEQLGATDEEIREIREDARKLEALNKLESFGFSAFDENNQAKPIIEIYAELGEVLAQIAGGYDNITKNQTTLGILGTVFGNRGITGALDIVTALQNAVDLRDKLLAGYATGYGEYAAETMMDTSYGTEEIFKSKIERLKQVVSTKFVRLTYTEGIEILKASGQQFEFPVEWGVDLQSEHERYLVEKHFGKPVILTDYPKDIKAFYMKQNDDGKTVRGTDVLFPKIGEIIGGSERESSLEKLNRRIEELHMDTTNLWWYIDTRRFGSCPHSGFGLGFERLLLFVTGMANIRDVIPFPRTPKTADF